MQDAVVLDEWEGFIPPVDGMPVTVDLEWAVLVGLDPIRERRPEFDPYAPDARDPLDRIVAGLRAADRALAGVLRDLVQAGPRDGLSVRRQVSLLAGATGSDVGFLDRAVQVFSAMPRTQAAFDEGVLSWSQVRGIVCEARRLSVAQRGVLDEALAGTVVQGRVRGEPDRVVEVCGDIAARLDIQGQERLEVAQERAQRLVLQPDFEGWGELHGLLSPEVTATVTAALDALADGPVAAGAPAAADDDGRVLPQAARPSTSRAAQWAEALGRMAALALGGRGIDGRPRRARPLLSVIAPLADLIDDADDGEGVGSVTARLLFRRGNGRRRVSRALTRALADDADLVAIFTDEHGMPAAIGDCCAPITAAMRRAVVARDQGCRAPGCSAPMEHCDVHHVIPRERDGPTEVNNLVAMCRPCHRRISLHRWEMTLRPDGTLSTRIGRHTYLTRPRLPGAGPSAAVRTSPGPSDRQPGSSEPVLR